MAVCGTYGSEAREPFAAVDGCDAAVASGEGVQCRRVLDSGDQFAACRLFRQGGSAYFYRHRWPMLQLALTQP